MPKDGGFEGSAVRPEARSGAAPVTSPVRLGALDLDAHLRDPSRKQRFVTPMFDTIAPRYDDFTRLFSLGMDGGWKREAVRGLAARVREAGIAAPRVLDLASGTGDLAFEVARALPTARVTALDASMRMIVEANARLADAGRDADVSVRVRTLVGDMDAIAMPDGSVDAITSGYGVRNTPDPARAVREMARVLRSGGVLVTLDFYRPELAPWRALLLGYLSAAGNLVGWLWHREPVVYGYIARSIDHFLSWQRFSALLEQEGFVVLATRRHLGGGIVLHEARRL